MASIQSTASIGLPKDEAGGRLSETALCRDACTLADSGSYFWAPACAVREKKGSRRMQAPIRRTVSPSGTTPCARSQSSRHRCRYAPCTPACLRSTRVRPRPRGARQGALGEQRGGRGVAVGLAGDRGRTRRIVRWTSERPDKAGRRVRNSDRRLEVSRGCGWRAACSRGWHGGQRSGWPERGRGDVGGLVRAGDGLPAPAHRRRRTGDSLRPPASGRGLSGGRAPLFHVGDRDAAVGGAGELGFGHRDRAVIG